MELLVEARYSRTKVGATKPCERENRAIALDDPPSESALFRLGLEDLLRILGDPTERQKEARQAANRTKRI